MRDKNNEKDDQDILNDFFWGRQNFENSDRESVRDLMEKYQEEEELFSEF